MLGSNDAYSNWRECRAYVLPDWISWLSPGPAKLHIHVQEIRGGLREPDRYLPQHANPPAHRHHDAATPLQF